MKSRYLRLSVLFLVLASSALASTTWYVDGVNGSDNNNCQSPQSACFTISHAISLASSGDTVMLAPAAYVGGITIPFSLNLIGAGSSTTSINGSVNGSSVVTIPDHVPSSIVTISGVTIQNGASVRDGGGISNFGQLTVTDSLIHRNTALFFGGGISTHGGVGHASLFVNRTTISGNEAPEGGGIQCFIPNSTAKINNSTIVANRATAGNGGGIVNGLTSTSSFCPLRITNSTIVQNVAAGSGGGIYGFALINSSTIFGNNAASGGGIYAFSETILVNNIVAGNSAGNGTGNCAGATASNGYNLSNDGTCNFGGPGDLNNTPPMLGSLGNNGGPTQTMALLPGSPAIDSGNPSGCTDSLGNPLGTDQRGMPRPDKEDTGGCDRGAYEKQSD